MPPRSYRHLPTRPAHHPNHVPGIACFCSEPHCPMTPSYRARVRCQRWPQSNPRRNHYA